MLATNTWSTSVIPASRIAIIAGYAAISARGKTNLTKV